MFDPVTMALCECECKENPEGGNAGGVVATLDLSEFGFNPLNAIMSGGGEGNVTHADLPKALKEAEGAEIVKLRFAVPGGGVFDAVCRSVCKHDIGLITVLDGVCLVDLTAAGAGILEVKMQVYPNINSVDSNPHYATTARVNIAVAPL